MELACGLHFAECLSIDCKCSIISCQYTSWSDNFKWPKMGPILWLIAKYLECHCYLCIKVAINQFQDIPLLITLSSDVHVLIVFVVIQKWLMQLVHVVSYSWKQFIFFRLSSTYYECATFHFTQPFCLFIFFHVAYIFTLVQSAVKGELSKFLPFTSQWKKTNMKQCEWIFCCVHNSNSWACSSRVSELSENFVLFFWITG